MHELSLMTDLVKILTEEAKKQKFQVIKKVSLEIGKLSNIEPEALKFCFDIVAKDSMAEGATFEIAIEPGRISCLDCGKETEVAEWGTGCEACGSFRCRIIGGDKMIIKSMEVE